MPVGTARIHHFQLVHFFRKRVNYNDAGISAGVRIGTIPAGAQIVGAHVRVLTAFNAATTNVLAVGTTGTGADIITSAESASTAAGWKSGATAQTVTFAADTDLYVSYTQTGTAATAGAADIIITYVPNTDQ